MMFNALIYSRYIVLIDIVGILQVGVYVPKILETEKKNPGKNLKLFQRLNSLHSLWGEITDFHFFKAVNGKFREFYFYTIQETLVAYRTMHLRNF